MKFLRRAEILSLFLVLLFLAGAVFGVPKVTNASTEVNPASTVVNPVSATVLNGFKETNSLSSSFPVILEVAIPLENLPLLQSMVTEISTPGSTEYRHFLSQSTIQQLFLPVSKFDSTLSFLQSNGFTVLSTAEDSMIVASGTIAQVQSVLGLTVGFYSNGTVGYYSASGTPAISGVYIYSSNVTGLIVQHPSQIVTESSTNVKDGPTGSPNVTSPIEAYDAADLRSVYNASSLVSSGYNGKGENIGLFEYYGDAYIAQELQAYDAEEGLPNPPSITVVPVGPYNPNLGDEFQASIEVSLDVEASHAMAPGANITVYVGNGALPWAPIIATVDQQDIVNVLSQSWFNPEIYYPYEGPSFMVFNNILTDQYFMLGSLEGITFTVASGDRGGTGFGGQPAGSQGWPATSPYVVSVGGLETYLTFSGTSVVSWYQTAWSNEGFEPTLANYGGDTGGVSNTEPKPWYQNNIATPASYPNGRLGPDLSLNAALWPGIFSVVDSRTIGLDTTGYTTIIIGGTSEASPLFAGLITVLDQKLDSRLGFITPALYKMGENSSLYTKDFTPITFGYSTPWTASYGFNLETGWGSPNIGEMAQYFSSVISTTYPTIEVYALNSLGQQPYEFTAGQNIYVNATVIPSNSSYHFTAELVTLQGTLAKVALTYAGNNNWTGMITVPSSASGISYLNVNGSVSGTQVFGFTQLFTGYIATILSPYAVPGLLPWSTLLGFNVTAVITNLNDNLVTSGSYNFTNYLYSISTNRYEAIGTQSLSYAPTEFAWTVPIIPYTQTGPMNILLNGGAFGFIPFIDEVGLTPVFIIPPQNAEPGAVSPGQYLRIEGTLQAPINTPDIISIESGLPLAETIDIASNFTASLVSPSGHVVSTANIGPTTSGSYLGYLQVPTSAKSGLYDIMMNTVYESIDLGMDVNGSYFGQVYVSDQPAIVPEITLVPNPVAEGRSLTIIANIAYANGTEVKYGNYAATLYPAYDSNNYAYYSELTAGEIPLWYNTVANRWVGSVVMPSATSLGWIGGVTPYDPGPGIVTTPVSGPWDAYVSGLSADGVPTTTNISAQHSFRVLDPRLTTVTIKSSSMASLISPISIAMTYLWAGSIRIAANANNIIGNFVGMGIMIVAAVISARFVSPTLKPSKSLVLTNRTGSSWMNKVMNQTFTIFSSRMI